MMVASSVNEDEVLDPSKENFILLFVLLGAFVLLVAAAILIGLFVARSS